MEQFYNETRRHSTIGYLNHVELESKVGLAQLAVYQTGSISIGLDNAEGPTIPFERRPFFLCLQAECKQKQIGQQPQNHADPEYSHATFLALSRSSYECCLRRFCGRAVQQATGNRSSFSKLKRRHTCRREDARSPLTSNQGRSECAGPRQPRRTR
jgi:hypothetical protein